MRESQIFLHNGRNYTTVQRITESVEKPLRKEQRNRWQLNSVTEKYDQQRKGITTENNSGLSLNDLFIISLFIIITTLLLTQLLFLKINLSSTLYLN